MMEMQREKEGRANKTGNLFINKFILKLMKLSISPFQSKGTKLVYI
jgi:hypothetical protein